MCSFRLGAGCHMGFTWYTSVDGNCNGNQPTDHYSMAPAKKVLAGHLTWAMTNEKADNLRKKKCIRGNKSVFLWKSKFESRKSQFIHFALLRTCCWGNTTEHSIQRRPNSKAGRNEWRWQRTRINVNVCKRLYGTGRRGPHAEMIERGIRRGPLPRVYSEAGLIPFTTLREDVSWVAGGSSVEGVLLTQILSEPTLSIQNNCRTHPLRLKALPWAQVQVRRRVGLAGWGKGRTIMAMDFKTIRKKYSFVNKEPQTTSQVS